MEFKLMQPQHADQVAEIHIEGQPGTLLTKLGHGFMSALYAGISQSPYGFGVVAVEGDQVASVSVVSTGTSRLFADLRSRQAVRLILPILPQLLKHPSLVRDIWNLWRYPSKASATNNQATSRRQKVEAEFLFFGTHPAYRRQHIGMCVFDRAIAQAILRGVRQVSAVVDQQNERMVTGFLEHGNKYGINGHDTVFLLGRPMYRLVMNVDEGFFDRMEQHEAFEREADWIPVKTGFEAVRSAQHAIT